MTNFGDGTISRYVAGADGTTRARTIPSQPRRSRARRACGDEALSADGRFLYALDADAQRVFGWAVEDDGSLTPVGSFDGLPATVAGLASS